MFESDYAKIEYIAEDNVVFHTWKKECHFENYRKPVEYSLKMLKDHKGSAFIVDATNGFEDVPEDVEWGFSYFLPEMKKTGCKIWIFILREISDIDGEIDMWSAEIQKYFTVLRVKSYNEAIESLNQLKIYGDADL